MVKKKTKKFLTVYTASYTWIHKRYGACHNVIGSYARRGDAIRELVDSMMHQLNSTPELREALLNDRNHGSSISKIVQLDDAIEDRISDKCEAALREYFRDELGGQGCYLIEAEGSNQDYRFDIDENDVEAKGGLQLWTCITSGYDDVNHDPEWEQPFPEVFLEEEDALECAMQDLKDTLQLDDRPFGNDAEVILAEARESLENDGYYEYRISDLMSRRWDIWSTPLDIGQGANHTQRG
jgi:hypothetical protein